MSLLKVNEIQKLDGSDYTTSELSQSYEFDTVALMTASAIVFPVGKALIVGGAPFTVVSGAGHVALSNGLFANADSYVTLKTFGAVEDADSTLAIIDAMNFQIANKVSIYYSGRYTYSSTTAGGTITFDYNNARDLEFSGIGFSSIRFTGSGTMWNIAAASSTKAFNMRNTKLDYIGVDTDATCMYISRNGVSNQWGGVISMYDSSVRYFTAIGIEMNQAFNATFKKVNFIGADGTTYNTDKLQPAVVGATSECVRITGGDPAWTGSKSFSNLNVFEQCEFQSAKYGVRGYHIRQTDFKSNTFQYLWIALSNVIDNINGDFSAGDMSLSGTNYFEFISNRCLADVPIDDDGVTEGTFVKRSKFIGLANTEYSQPAQYSGALERSQSGIWNGIRHDEEDGGYSADDWVKLVNLTVSSADRVFGIEHNGTVFTREGYDFGAMAAPDSPFTNSNVLKEYKYSQLTNYTSMVGTTGSPSVAASTTYETYIGKIATWVYEVSSVSTDGTGQVVLKIANSYCKTVVSVEVVSNQLGGTTPTKIYAKPIGGLTATEVYLYTDAALTTPLNWVTDLSIAGANLFVISCSYLKV